MALIAAHLHAGVILVVTPVQRRLLGSQSVPLRRQLGVNQFNQLTKAEIIFDLIPTKVGLACYTQPCAVRQYTQTSHKTKDLQKCTYIVRPCTEQIISAARHIELAILLLRVSLDG